MEEKLHTAIVQALQYAEVDENGAPVSFEHPLAEAIYSNAKAQLDGVCKAYVKADHIDLDLADLDAKVAAARAE